jgi:outer membrane lipoprotein
VNKIFLLMCLTLTACSSLPPAIKDPPAYDLQYPEASINLGKFTNAPVRWAGKIVEIENEPAYSALQVLAYPVGSSGRPEIDEASQGRFVVKSPGFLDPAVYKKETAVTVAGSIAGETERKIGNKSLKLPLVNANAIHLWQAIDYDRYGYYGGFGYGYGGGFGYPYGGFYGYGPYHRGALYGYSPYFRGGGYYSPYRRW